MKEDVIMGALLFSVAFAGRPDAEDLYGEGYRGSNFSEAVFDAVPYIAYVVFTYGLIRLVGERLKVNETVGKALAVGLTGAVFIILPQWLIIAFGLTELIAFLTYFFPDTMHAIYMMLAMMVGMTIAFCLVTSPWLKGWSADGVVMILAGEIVLIVLMLIAKWWKGKEIHRL